MLMLILILLYLITSGNGYGFGIIIHSTFLSFRIAFMIQKDLKLYY